MAGRQEGAAGFGGLHDEGAEGHAAHDPVPAGEVLGVRPCPQGILGDERAALGDLLGQSAVLPGVYHVDAAAENGEGAESALDRRPVRRRVDATGQPADDGYAGMGQALGELAGRLPPVGRGPPGADDGDGPLVLRDDLPLDVEDGRQVVYLLEAGRILVVVPGEGADAALLQPAQLGVRVDGGPSGYDHLRGASVQPGGLEGGAAGLPRCGQGAEVLLQQQEPRPPDAGHAVEGEPVL